MAQALLSILGRLHDARLARYILASIGALAVDVGSFLAFMEAGLHPTPASAVGYSLGIAAHWLMSSRAVFQDTVAQDGAARTRQKALFVVSALIGLGLTTVIVALGDWAGLPPLIGKGAAILVSFTATWLLRSKVIFRADLARDG
ncbi:MAG: GtrA family protein [Pseudomonadota bacterium]